MSVLITGGSGLVGSSLKEIYPNGIYINSKDCDLRCLNDVKSLFEKYRPEYVIHLAANVGGLFKNMVKKVEMFEDNMLININVIKCCHKYNIKRAIFCLSTCIFPDKTEYPINEDMLHLGPPHSSNDSYAYSKRMVEVLCNAYNKQYSTNYVCVIPTNIYGPNDNFSLTDGHVIPALINRCYSNDEFNIKGTGLPLRQFIYSKDLAKLIKWVLFEYTKNDTIILSNMEEVSIKRIANIIGNKLNKKPIFTNNKDEDGQFKKTSSNKKLLSYLSNFKFTSIEEGLNTTIEWFIENHPNVRL